MRVIRSTSHASASARSDGGRRSQAWKPERETPSSLHNSEIEWLAFSAAMNRNRLTASRSPSRRRPRLFSRSPAPARATTPAGAVRAAPRARRRSGHRAHPARSALAAPTAAATPATHRDRRRSPQASDPFERRAPPLHAETPAGTAFGTSASLAWPDSLSAGPDSAQLSTKPGAFQRRDPARLRRGAREREGCNGGRLPAPGARLLPQLRDLRRAGADRQRPRLSLARARARLQGARAQALAHAPLPAVHEREGGALHPHAARRLGLQRALRDLRGAAAGLGRLARVLQSAPTTRLPRPPTARRAPPGAQEQRGWVLQLAVAVRAAA